MNKVLETDQKTSQNGELFVPLSHFQETSHLKALFPYQTSFSLSNLLHRLLEIDSKFSEKPGGKIQEALKALDPLLKKGNNFTPEEVVEVSEWIDRLFPFLFYEDQMGFISVPFVKEYLYVTKAMDERIGLGEWEVKVPDFKRVGINHMITSAGCLILNRHYGQNFELTYPEVLTVRHTKTGLERHFKINIVKDYIECKVLKPLKKLSEQKIYQLLNAWDDPKIWLKHLPPENFAFEGFVIGYLSDVTDVTILSKLKEMILEETKDDDPSIMLDQINRQVRSFLGMPDIQFGNLVDPETSIYQHGMWSIIGPLEVMRSIEKEAYYESPYKIPLKERRAVIFPDLKKEPPGKVTQQLLSRGFRSLLLVPIHDSSGQFQGVFELGSKNTYQFSQHTVFELKEILVLYAVGMTNWMREMENMVNVFIQEQFTSIHPSVEWKFQEVSQNFLWSQEFGGEGAPLEPIQFKQVYPLYGQADIVGSSKLRNQSILADMVDNLTKLSKLIENCLEKVEFHLLEMELDRIKEKLKALERGEFISSDESAIVEWVTNGVHPLLRQLFDHFPELPKEKLQSYFEYLDPELGIVYRQRKAYEDSVSQLNQIMASFIEEEDQKMQELLPHFFEKYTTDGVEYNLYLGQSLLKEGHFSEFFLQDFRLWQLQLMCRLTKLVERSAKNLPIPLKTAQLIFVYNNALSIRFFMEEKQFDVDGAYNVRYEILKKRIDKAVIKGTGERLTQAGKIAIVWLQEKDKREYLDYLQYLLRKGLISEEIEELELEPLQGAEGLKAIRVTVV